MARLNGSSFFGSRMSDDEPLLQRRAGAEATVLGGEEQLGRPLLGRRELHGDVPAEDVDQEGRRHDALPDFGLRRRHHLVAFRMGLA